MNGKRSEKKTNNKHANQASGTNVTSIVQAIRRHILKAFVMNMLKAYARGFFDTGSLAARCAGGELALACESIAFRQPEDRRRVSQDAPRPPT